MNNKNLLKVRASLIELFKRFTPVIKDKDKEVYHNGDNNLYPNEIERIVTNSPTASRAAKVMAKFIAGKGLRNELQDIIVDERKNYRLSNVISFAAEDMAFQGGVFFHVRYGISEIDGSIVPSELSVLDYTKCRIEKEDDDDNECKIFYRDYCDTSFKFINRNQSKGLKWFYPFNKNQDVIRAQIARDSGNESDIIEAIKDYRGQVFYLNLTPKYKYALAPVDSVYNDADSEYRFTLYTNTQMRTGFLGKTVALTVGLDDEQGLKVEEDLQKFLGSENSGSLYHLDVERAEDIDKIIKFIQLKPQFDDKLFEANTSRIRRNILGAFNNIPEPLIFAGEGAIFGTNAEAYNEMKLFYSEQTEDERWKLSETITYLGFPCEIKPIIERENTDLQTIPTVITE